MAELKINPKALNEDAKMLLNNEVRTLLTELHLSLNPERKKLLQAREKLQQEFNSGKLPEYISDHPASLEDWQVAKLPEDIQERRVEITGPVNSTKMVINMLSEGPDGVAADMAMLDFEDSMKPTWENIMSGVQNVIGAAKESLEFSSGDKSYQLDPKKMAHMMIRIRGLHLAESNITVDGEKISGGLLDLTLCAYHSAKILLNKKKTPMYYVPKCENYLEARWWHKLFSLVEEKVGIPHGSLRTTFLIETLPGAFQMEEILYEIRERSAGLNGGRWDKIFSDIKVLGYHKDRIMADRSTIDMTRPWMDNYAKRLIQICHKHGAFAMGGMSAFTPGKDAKVREEQTKKVLADKGREAEIGHDGCWVSHPYFIGPARAQFKKKNQLDVKLKDFPNRPDLLPTSEGPKTLAGLRTNIRVAIAYTNGWNQGLGCVAFDNLMEDLATLEISRAQTWQWLHHKIKLDDGTAVTKELVTKIFAEESKKIIEEFGGDKVKTQIEKARDLAKEIFLKEDLPAFYSFESELA